jgi:hypothetical protein
MPLIYHAQCETCGRGPEVTGSVLVDEVKDNPDGGKEFLDWYLALKMDDGKFVGLPHPGEHFHLKKHGLTLEKAVRERRLYSLEYKICSRCGLVHEEARMKLQEWTWLVFPGVGAITFTVVRIGWGLSWKMCVLNAMIVTFVVGLGQGVLKGTGRLKTQEESKLVQCAGCGCGEFILFSEAAREPLLCPFCKKKTMRYSCEAIA